MAESANRITRPRNNGVLGQPPWDIAVLFPTQGDWTEEEYLALENRGGRLIELVDGVIEVLPLPDLFHQGILRYLVEKLNEFAKESKQGEVFFAPLPVRLGQGHLREPDLAFLKPTRIKSRRKPPEGADLVMEILSPGKKNRERDLKDKRRAYARARIPEYWLVDPERLTITVLALHGKVYKVHGKYKAGANAASKLLPGFAVDVARVFAAGRGE